MEEAVGKKQLSLTEWFAQIKHGATEALRAEDNTKRERLDVLSKCIPIKYDKPTKFSAKDFYDQTAEVKHYLAEHGDEACALRLVSADPSLPKLRIRGKSVTESMPWFREQQIEHAQYEVHVVPHALPLFSTIFMINKQGIQGEIIRGLHSELTQGYTTSGIMSFYFDFAAWSFSNEDHELQQHMQKIVAQLEVNRLVQEKIRHALQGEFTHEYLEGYFETTTWPNGEILFIDYNRILHKDVSLFPNIGKRSEGKLSGQIARPGRVRGYVKLVNDENVATLDVSEQDILVCRMTSIDYLPLMGKAAAIVTDLGGILSHAAIVARELGKPCIVGVENATAVLQSGDFIEVNADLGEIQKLK